MKSIKIFSLALLLISVCFSQKRGIGLMESKKQSFYKNSWAVIIGINDYIRAPKLKYAVRDAEEFTEVLVNYYGFKRENIVKLIDREATRGNIMKAFDKLRSKAGKEDRVLVFFAGHGITVSLPDGREKGYILPVDGSQDELITSAISTDQLNEISQLIKAKHLFFIMDACYGGLIFARAQPLSPSALDYLEVITTRRARKALTAGGRDQTVLDTGPGGHSVFTYYLIDGLKNRTADLNGDGIITSGELNEYVAPRVTAESNRSQTPEYGILAGDMGGDFVFIPGEFIVVPKEARNSVDFVVKVEEFPDAKIYIDGSYIGSGYVKIEAPIQKKVNVIVEKEGYKRYQAEIFVYDKPVELRVKLEPIKSEQNWKAAGFIFGFRGEQQPVGFGFFIYGSGIFLNFKGMADHAYLGGIGFNKGDNKEDFEYSFALLNYGLNYTTRINDKVSIGILGEFGVAFLNKPEEVNKIAWGAGGFIAYSKKTDFKIFLSVKNSTVSGIIRYVGVEFGTIF
jgi:hypothetical protein